VAWTTALGRRAVREQRLAMPNLTDPTSLALGAALLACILGAAVMAVAEVSLLRVRRSAIQVEAEQGNRGARRLLLLLDELPLVLNTVLLVVLLLQVGAATVTVLFAERVFGGIWVTAASVIVTMALFMYGEAIPKTMAVRAPQRYALRLTPILSTIALLFRPLVHGLLWLANRQSRGERPADAAVSEAELRALARESAEMGAIAGADAILVERSFEFGDRRVGEVMVARDRIVSIADTDTVAHAFETAISSGHRRLPVRRGDLDDVIGIVRLRDVAAAARESSVSAASEVTSRVLSCDSGYPIASLLRDMQSASLWMAVVKDDWGHTVGIATVEDLMAELVGELADERAVVRRRRRRR